MIKFKKQLRVLKSINIFTIPLKYLFLDQKYKI